MPKPVLDLIEPAGQNPADIAYLKALFHSLCPFDIVFP
jgi:hypothetical protein